MVPRTAMTTPRVSRMPTRTSSRRFIRWVVEASSFLTSFGMTHLLGSNELGKHRRDDRVEHEDRRRRDHDRLRRRPPHALRARSGHVPLVRAHHRDRATEAYRLDDAVDHLERREAESEPGPVLVRR